MVHFQAENRVVAKDEWMDGSRACLVDGWLYGSNEGSDESRSDG